MRVLFLCLSFILSLNTYAMSKAYRGGEIGISIRQNSPCFFISTNNLSGRYQLNVFEQTNFRKLFTFDNAFENRYPLENQCISFVNNNLKKGEIYTAVLDTGTTSFGSDFCIITIDGRNKIGHFDGKKCFIPEISWFDKLLNYFR